VILITLAGTANEVRRRRSTSTVLAMARVATGSEKRFDLFQPSIGCEL
jgi:hypothetical protein